MELASEFVVSPLLPIFSIWPRNCLALGKDAITLIMMRLPRRPAYLLVHTLVNVSFVIVWPFRKLISVSVTLAFLNAFFNMCPSMLYDDELHSLVCIVCSYAALLCWLREFASLSSMCLRLWSFTSQSELDHSLSGAVSCMIHRLLRDS